MTEAEHHIAKAQSGGPASQGLAGSAAALTAVCRLLPLPVVDGLLVDLVHRHMLRSLLRRHGRPRAASSAMGPLYGKRGGCVVRVVKFVLLLPFKLVIGIIKKIFKTILFFLAARDAALQAAQTVLLGRTIERCLADGRLHAPTKRDGAEFGKASRTSDRVDRAFRTAFRGSDWRFLRRVFSSIPRRGGHLLGIGTALLSTVRRGGGERSLEADLDRLNNRDRGLVDKLAAEVADVLGREEWRLYAREFDSLFDEAWNADAR